MSYWSRQTARLRRQGDDACNCSYNWCVVFRSVFTAILFLTCAVAGQDLPARDSCASAAKRLLGPNAELVKYGQFAGANGMDGIAVVKIRRTNDDRLLVTDLAILHWAGGGWKAVLRASKSITNDAGYIGIDYIDDEFRFYGYEAQFAGRRSDGKPGFALMLSYLTRTLNRDGIPIEIAWNPTTGRFQELSINEEPEGFKAELKNPPHRRVQK